MEDKNYIDILIDPKNDVRLKIVAHSSPSDIQEINREEALKNHESPYQLKEGCSYEFELNKEAYRIECNHSGIISESKIQSKTQRGFIKPNIYVGTLQLRLVDSQDNSSVKNFELEIQSVKTRYRENYRDMLLDITEKSIDLLFQINSPVLQSVHVDYEEESNDDAVYQKYSFVKSIVESQEFEESLLRIISNPSTKWQSKDEEKDVRRIKRISRKEVKQLIHGSSRIVLPANHSLKKFGLKSISAKVRTSRQIETLDTPENRFVKFVLEEFLDFFLSTKQLVKDGSFEDRELKTMSEKLEGYLHHGVFRECSRLSSIPLNSPVLQRKEGYRVVLKSWLMFDLAAKLGWQGGEDIYGVGKKNIAALYEYWLFFKLLEIFENTFEIEAKEIEKLFSTNSGLNLNLKQGKHLALDGIYNNGKRKLKIQFSFNRSFKSVHEYPVEGSWTKAMRPDFTLSIWPEYLDVNEAENQEEITHIHFDAKYKVDKISEIFGEAADGSEEEYLDEEKKEQQKGNYKRADLLKMHAYKDAIRRTGGAYVLYPGENGASPFRGFHELLPGLGAFAVRPSESNSGIEHLQQFITDVISQIEDRNSSREKVSNKISKVYSVKQRKSSDSLNESYRFPESIDGVKIIPDETFVIVGYVKSKKHLEWIEGRNLYNARYGEEYSLGIEESSAQFLLLYSSDKSFGRFYKLTDGPLLCSKKQLKTKYGYPTKPSEDSYALYQFRELSNFEEFEYDWVVPVSPNKKYETFSIKLSELLNAK